MARKESVQDGGITLGRWKLHPLDDCNWELCERRNGKWCPLGRYYQHNTFHLAIQYAADCELKDECHGRVMELQDALGEYERIVGEMVAALLPQAREVVA